MAKTLDKMSKFELRQHIARLEEQVRKSDHSITILGGEITRLKYELSMRPKHPEQPELPIHHSDVGFLKTLKPIPHHRKR